MKYVIIGFNDPNLECSIANIKVLCHDNHNFYWEKTTMKENKKEWFRFNTREETDNFIKELNFELCTSYGVRE